VAPAAEPLPAGTLLDPALWAWGEVPSGVATLSAPLVDAFVPQMLNYESVDGVSFKKGCYPGQEVVARSQFRGAIKRRAYIAHADAPLNVGAEVFSPQDAEQQPAVLWCRQRLRQAAGGTPSFRSRSS
jgi:folate-binding protein YgfZ